MDKLSIDRLHQLRLDIFDNAESLHKEAGLLFDHGFYARAYLLAYFVCEELGKIPIVVGVITRIMQNETVDWTKAMRRFRSHIAKVNSDDFHQYVFGIELDLERNSDLKWLEAARISSRERVLRKNNSTYVDIQGEHVITPAEKITKENAAEMIERAFHSLNAHWHAECLTNPIIIKGYESLNSHTPKVI